MNYELRDCGLRIEDYELRNCELGTAPAKLRTLLAQLDREAERKKDR